LNDEKFAIGFWSRRESSMLSFLKLSQGPAGRDGEAWADDSRACHVEKAGAPHSAGRSIFALTSTAQFSAANRGIPPWFTVVPRLHLTAFLQKGSEPAVMSESETRPANSAADANGDADEDRIVGDDGLAILACYSCKRRKVKCNRALPACGLCTKIGVSCDYPTHAEKPGPKAGMYILRIRR
jgi:hypothetical protein